MVAINHIAVRSLGLEFGFVGLQRINLAIRGVETVGELLVVLRKTLHIRVLSKYNAREVSSWRRTSD